MTLVVKTQFLMKNTFFFNALIFFYHFATDLSCSYYRKTRLGLYKPKAFDVTHFIKLSVIVTEYCEKNILASFLFLASLRTCVFSYSIGNVISRENFPVAKEAGHHLWTKRQTQLFHSTNLCQVWHYDNNSDITNLLTK